MPCRIIALFMLVVSVAPAWAADDVQVVNALDGKGISGATVIYKYQGRKYEHTTGRDGYTEQINLPGVPVGATVHYSITAQGFAGIEDDCIREDNYNPCVQGRPRNLSPVGDFRLRVTLAWGDSPRDLDAQMWFGDRESGQGKRVFWKSMVVDNVELDIDDTNGRGPETITVNEMDSSRHMFLVHNYSDKDTSGNYNLSRSGAKVTLFAGDRMLRRFTVPVDQPGKVWHVFNIKGVEIGVVDRIVDPKD